MKRLTKILASVLMLASMGASATAADAAAKPAPLTPAVATTSDAMAPTDGATRGSGLVLLALLGAGVAVAKWRFDRGVEETAAD